MPQITPGTWLKINGEADADYAWSMEGLANAAGRVSAQIDLGAAPRDTLVMWSCKVQFQATPTQYTTLDFYYAAARNGASTDIWGDVGASDAALGDLDQRYNLRLFGSVTVEEADTTTMISGGHFFFPFRYLTLIGYNGSGAAINATDSNFLFYVSLAALS